MQGARYKDWLWDLYHWHERKSDCFSHLLFDLMVKADDDNFKILSKAYPEASVVVIMFKENGPSIFNHLKGQIYAVPAADQAK